MGTTGAVAVEFHFVIDQTELMGSADGFLECLNAIILKFYYFPALKTDEMVMVVIGDMLIPHLPPKLPFVGQATLPQELEGPVNGRITDLGIALSKEAKPLLDREVAVFFKKLLDDQVPLACCMKPLFLQVGGKNSLFIRSERHRS